jgi:hypothetical protein
VFDWLPGAAEVDVGQSHHRTWIDGNGRRHSAVGYISKQMTPQAWYGRGLIRKPGGPVLGKRGGTTRNLDRRARAAFRESWPPYCGGPPTSVASDAGWSVRTLPTPICAPKVAPPMRSGPLRAGASR